MAKLSVVKRQLRREFLVQKYSEIRQKLKAELRQSTSFKNKLELESKLQKLPRDSSRTRLKNRCWKTGRGHSVFRDFGLCRHQVREMANQGLLPGVVKSSW